MCVCWFLVVCVCRVGALIKGVRHDPTVALGSAGVVIIVESREWRNGELCLFWGMQEGGCGGEGGE